MEVELKRSKVSQYCQLDKRERSRQGGSNSHKIVGASSYPHDTEHQEVVLQC